jgi:hypothetical protein
MDLCSDDGTYHSGLYLWKFYELVRKAAKKHGLTTHPDQLSARDKKNLTLT